MKYIKKFEMNDDVLKIGDYVICSYYNNDIGFEFFLSNNIGKLIEIKNDFNNYREPYVVEFESVDINAKRYTTTIKANTITFKRSEIQYWSNNKEDLELYIQSNKFNL